jgi:hypothetical protein
MSINPPIFALRFPPPERGRIKVGVVFCFCGFLKKTKDHPLLTSPFQGEGEK